MIRTLVTTLAITAFCMMSHAADQRQVGQLVSKLKQNAKALGNPDGTSLELPISLEPDGRDPSPVVFYYGRMVEKTKVAEMEKDLEEKGIKPWPLQPTFVVFIPVMMCTLYLIDEKSNGTVTHSGQMCSAWGGWLGQNDGSADKFFNHLGGPQKVYDGIIEKALKQIKK